jgi:hypothetical protein
MLKEEPGLNYILIFILIMFWLIALLYTFGILTHG